MSTVFNEAFYLERINAKNKPEYNHGLLQQAINCHKVEKVKITHTKEERVLLSTLKAAWKAKQLPSNVH